MRSDLQIVLLHEERRHAVVVEEQIAFVVDRHRLVVLEREHFPYSLPWTLPSKYICLGPLSLFSDKISDRQFNC